MVGIPILFVVSLFTDRGYYPNVDAVTEKTVQEQPSENSSPAPILNPRPRLNFENEKINIPETTINANQKILSSARAVALRV